MEAMRQEIFLFVERQTGEELVGTGSVSENRKDRSEKDL